MKRCVVFGLAARAARRSRACRPQGEKRWLHHGQDRRRDALVFYEQNMNCSTAKKYAHRLMRDGSYDPKNFKCERHSPTQGGCTHRLRPRRFFIFYPEH
jgi:hypothetical protein